MYRLSAKTAALGFILAAVAAFVSTSGQAQREGDGLPYYLGGEVLKELGEVTVIIESLPTDAADAGVSERELQTSTELHLRRMGIRVIEREKATWKTPYVYVRVSMTTHDVGLVCCVIRVELHEGVMSYRGFKCFATTWSKGSYAMSGELRAKTVVGEDLSSLLDTFENDYLKANPR